MRIEQGRGQSYVPSLPSPSALPYQVAVAGCHSGSTTLCAAPDASPETKRNAAMTSNARSTAWTEKKPLAAEELEDAAAMARTHVKTEEQSTAAQPAGTSRMAVVVVVLPPLFLGSLLSLREPPVPDAQIAQSCAPCTNGVEGTMGMHE
nr:unnamed protein product [Digitaria exilis]